MSRPFCRCRACDPEAHAPEVDADEDERDLEDDAGDDWPWQRDFNPEDDDP